MRVISKKPLRKYWEQNPETEMPLKAWHTEAKKADWATPADVKEKYRSASILKEGRVVFNICGNKHRLIVKINYAYKVVYIRFIGTHETYDKTDAQEI